MTSTRAVTTTTTSTTTTTTTAFVKAKKSSKKKSRRNRKKGKTVDYSTLFDLNTDNLELEDAAVSGPVSPNEKNSIFSMGRSQSRGAVNGIHPNTRKIAGMLRHRMLAMGIQIRFLDLLGYGCWCSFLIRHDLRPRNKEPSDKIDEICRKWSKCHECSSIDSYYQCSAQGHDIYQVQGIIATGKFTCASNEDSCALRSCECDTELVYKLSDLLANDPKNFNIMNSYEKGFSPYSQCIEKRMMSDRKSDKCCGEFPDRFPFWSNMSQKACCGSKTYDVNLFDCCHGAKLVPKSMNCPRQM